MLADPFGEDSLGAGLLCYYRQRLPMSASDVALYALTHAMVGRQGTAWLWPNAGNRSWRATSLATGICGSVSLLGWTEREGVQARRSRDKARRKGQTVTCTHRPAAVLMSMAYCCKQTSSVFCLPPRAVLTRKRCRVLSCSPDPEVGVIDTTVVVETDLQSGSPSMCS